MSDDTIQITVDGKILQAKKGQMLIEVTDNAGIDVPRFCYHKKLSVAANCRMCLVEVEKAPKPLPACATPVMPNMVVHTQSELAHKAQQGTMEFLLINHPLDCPICDQGGECELQDVAMGYGGDVSQYTESKRVVMDKYIGPLIATEMTRCIHCTRCVRFGEEIAGVREMGATGRGENVRIGTFIEKSVVSEVSGNIIDICPVGALTARPSRFTARAWELTQAPAVAAHDSVGSNIYVHVDNGVVNRVVPRDNEEINEVWISDRDRFSYQAYSSSDRLQQPMARIEGVLQTTDWKTALAAASGALRKAGPQLNTLVSAQATLEELYLAQKLTRALGSNNVDHRLSQTDFSDQQQAPVMPWLTMDVAGLEGLQAALLIGSDIRKEQPIAAIRLRKSALNGAKISLINFKKMPLHFDALENLGVTPGQMLLELAAIAKALGAGTSRISGMPDVEIEPRHQAIAESLSQSGDAIVLLGSSAVSHPQFTLLRTLAALVARQSKSKLAYLPEAANTCGAWLSGCIPHRIAGGKAIKENGKNALQMLTEVADTTLLFGVEPELDSAEPTQALDVLKNSKAVCISSFISDEMRDYADVILPLACHFESAGTLVNASGRWQFSRGMTKPLGDSRPGWKILRALGTELEFEEFAFNGPDEVKKELQEQCQSIQLSNNYDSQATVWPVAESKDSLLRVGTTAIYAADPVVRRANALQKTADGKSANNVLINSALAESKGLNTGDLARVKQKGVAELQVCIDDRVPDHCVWVSSGVKASSGLGRVFTAIELEKVN